ncbi:ribonuclease H-like domain-containing protein [Rhizophagus clarus]|uniref:Ribonuclease H-like domain-containing protein n=1 Tax=Rhizophagus clarus TaxID=94130 RepID=A0A8H3MHB7_9GLOM|nr:ribonuclease H-like domain-containing protein [Rhizophagus clarus]
MNGDMASPSPLCDSSGLPPPVVLPSGSHYWYYTDGSLINLGSPEVSMGWSWVQIIHDAGYLNSVATYAYGTIRNWPSSTRVETAAIYAALSVTPKDSVVSLYTDSQAAIDGLHSCSSSTYTNSRFYYKTTNFELWASIECCIREKRLSVLPVKVKGHDGNYWNDFADSLANSAHQSDDAFPLPEAIITSSHNVRLVYDNIVFYFCLTDRDDYIVDWDLTWFTLNYSPSHDASFHAHHASRHYTFKFKLFLDDLPLLEKLKITQLSIPRQSAMKDVAAIHNNFIQKLRRRIWNLRTYDKSRWENAMHITLKLKTTPQPSNLPAFTYVPFSSLPLLTHLVTSRDSGTDWIKNSMLQGLPCGRVIRYYVSIVASTLVGIYQGGRSKEI